VSRKKNLLCISCMRLRPPDHFGCSINDAVCKNCVLKTYARMQQLRERQVDGVLRRDIPRNGSRS